MLKSAFIAMTVLGCDCDAKMCEYIRTTPAAWSSMSECEEALKSQAVRDSDSGYPTIVAVCRSTQESPARVASTPAIDTTRTASTAITGSTELATQGESRSIMMRAADRYVVARNAVVGVAGGTVELVGGVAYGTLDVVSDYAGGAVDAVSGVAGWVYHSAADLF